MTVDYYSNLFLLHSIIEKYYVMGDINGFIRLEFIKTMHTDSFLLLFLLVDKSKIQINASLQILLLVKQRIKVKGRFPSPNTSQ